jgi:outer membrane protein assembly factor BamB
VGFRAFWWIGCAAVAMTVACGREDETADAQVSQAAHVEGAGCTLSEHDGRAYLFCEGQETWTNARSQCLARPGFDIVRIDSAGENAFVSSLLTNDAWIGGNDRSVEGAWRWSEGGSDDGPQFWSGKSGGSPVGGLYSNWKSGQPNDFANQDCAELSPGGGWDDKDCGGKKAYVCEGDACPDDPDKVVPGVCGCGVADTDSDGDGRPDCLDECPGDPSKIAPGDCGCSDAPVAAGAECADGLCAAASTCDGAGSCGTPDACAPAPGCTFARLTGSPSRGYFFCTEPLSWDAARAACRSVPGGDLARIDDVDENAFVFAGIAGPAWIRGNDRISRGSWRWAQAGSLDGDRFWSGGASGKPVGGLYANWAPGEPDGFSDRCARMDPAAGGGWRDASCAAGAAFVCEVAVEPDRGLQAGAPWPMLGRTPPQPSRSTAVAAQTPDLNWVTDLGTGLPAGPPVVATDETIYVASGSRLFALDPEGQVIWSFEAGGALNGAPAIGADGTLYVVSDDKRVYAITAAGIEHWRHNTRDRMRGSPAVAPDGTVLVATDDDLVALSPHGKELWSVSTGNAADLSPSIAPDGTILIGSKSREKLYAISPGGVRLWGHSTGIRNVQTSAAVGPDGVAYYGARRSLVAVAPDESRLWLVDTAGEVWSNPALSPDSGTLYVGSDDGRIHALDTATGATRWARSLGGPVRSSPAVGRDGLVYIGTPGGAVVALGPEDGNEAWSLPADGGVRSALAIGSNGTVYAGAGTGKVYSIGGAPEPFVTCVSEVAPGAYAALFGYENRVGIEIEIHRGPQNFLTPEADGPESEPLTRFQPGRVERGYWSLMTTPELSWTLRGRTVTATSASPGCGTEAYPSRSGFENRGERPSPPLSRKEKLIPYFKDPAYDPDSSGSLFGISTATTTSGDTGTVQQALGTLEGDFTVHLTRLFPGHDLGLGDCDVPHYETRVTINGQSCGFAFVAGSNVCDKCSFPLCCGACGVALSVNISYSCSKPVDVMAATVPVQIELREVDDLTTSETLANVHLMIDNSTREVLSASGGTLSGSNVVVAADSGWGVEFEVITTGIPAALPPVRLCPKWNTDYVDEGFGEGVRGERADLAEPGIYAASYAQFELRAEGFFGSHSAAGFLDELGCVTLDSDAARALVHLPDAGTDPQAGGLALELEVFTVLERPDGAGYFVGITTGPGPREAEASCFSTATGGVVPLETWLSEGIWAVAPGKVPLRLINRGSGETVTPLMNIAATMSRILAAEDIALGPTQKLAVYATRPGEGCEFDGIVDSCVDGSTLFIGPSSRPPDADPCTTDDDCPSVQQCFAVRPPGDLFTDEPCPGTAGSCECRWPDQARWKFVIAHEAGHQIQDEITGAFNSADYTFPCPPNTTCSGRQTGFSHVRGELVDPPFIEQYGFCGCQHVTAANAEHCLQSVERGGAAQGEGIAQWFASRVWNDRSDPDCRFVYYKEFFGETCLGRNPEDCLPETVFRNTGIKTLPPFGVPCDQPIKWRNRRCPISEAAEFGTELDWLQFLYSLNTAGSLASPMADVWAIYRHTCNPPAPGTLPLPDPGLCGSSHEVAWTSRPPAVLGSARACSASNTSQCVRGERCLDGQVGSSAPCAPGALSCLCKVPAVEGFLDGARRLYGPDGPQVDPARRERVETFGRDYGVSRDLSR